MYVVHNGSAKKLLDLALVGMLAPVAFVFVGSLFSRCPVSLYEFVTCFGDDYLLDHIVTSTYVWPESNIKYRHNQGVPTYF